MKSKYGNYAVLGNHDIGTYLPDIESPDIEMTIRNLSQLVERSGYSLLSNNNKIITIGQAMLVLAGAETRGRHPGIIHPDIGKAMQGTDSADLRRLLSHDPNHWNEVLNNYPKVELTLSGHTHGMQFGIITSWFRWSPAQYFYPRWSGLYKERKNLLYVNRGLGTLGIPVRIGIPPEVTIITIVTK
jgi:predicted MPP superfamily phosphohydrolase